MMKKRYHSDFILQYKLGLLPKHIVDDVSASTKHYWHNQAYNNFFAPEVLYAQEKNMEYGKSVFITKGIVICWQSSVSGFSPNSKGDATF